MCCHTVLLCSSYFIAHYLPGCRLEGYIFRFIEIASSSECGQHCLADQRCQSINYKSGVSKFDLIVCELNNCTNDEKPDSLSRITVKEWEKGMGLEVTVLGLRLDLGLEKSKNKMEKVVVWLHIVQL